jgi:hypothetical protein
MAAPLFVTDEATLKSKLRLSSVPASATDTEAIIDQAILDARVQFYIALGEIRVAAILATPFSETPTTEAGILRALASLTEVMMVRCYLLVHLPTTFMDASGDVNERWNTEAPLREKGVLDAEAEILACQNKIKENLLILAANDTDECQEIQVYDGTPDRQTQFPANTPRVGMSLKRPTGIVPPCPED